jgi:aarF domain-containing kinase
MMPELLPGVQYTVELFVAQLVRRLALRLADDLDPSAAPRSSAAWDTSKWRAPAACAPG